MKRPDEKTILYAGNFRAKENLAKLLETTINFMVIGLLSLTLLTGCAVVGPDYVPPETSSPPGWHTPLEDGLTRTTDSPETMARWWMILGDPLLNSFVKRGIDGNLGLKEAAARVKEARALKGLSESALMPSADTSALALKNHNSTNAGGTGEGEFYSAGFDAGWELDLFGGNQRAAEASQADLEAYEAALNGALVSLAAEIAINYVNVRISQARLAAAGANLKTQRKAYELNEARYQAGLIHELAVKQSLYNLEYTRSQIPRLQANLASARNRLSILLGLTPGTLDKELEVQGPIPVPPVSVAVGVPAETLRRRPDIRQAERNLAARTAEIGEATADLYPKFKLFGTIGIESLSFENLPEWASRTWAIGPSVSWNIFDAGAVRHNIDVKTARQEQALIQYEKAILLALEEVENALTAYIREQNRRDALSRAVNAACQAEQLAMDRYTTGLVGFNDVLEAQRSLLSFQDDLAISQGEVTAGLIRLYKALGGGWEQMKQPDS